MELAKEIQKKLMDLLASRPHSELELRNKLLHRFAEEPEAAEAIEAALENARQKRWLPDAEDLAAQTVSALRKKGKGTNYINQYLAERGLPSIPLDSELELEKALELIKTKFCSIESFDSDDQVRAARFLASRGFDEEIVRKVIYEKF